MRNTSFAAVLAVLLVACGGGGGAPAASDSSVVPPSPSPPPSSGPSPAELLAEELDGLPLDEFYEVSFGALLSRSPETVVWQGLEAFYPLDSVGLDDLSELYRRDTYAMAAVVLDMLGDYDRASLGVSGQRDYDVYEFYLTDFVDEGNFFFYGYPASYSIFGEIGGTELFFTSAHPLEDRQDAENYISRLLVVDTKMTQLAGHLELQRMNGVVEPRITMQVSLNRVRQLLNSNPRTIEYYTSFSERIREIADLSPEEIRDLESRALNAVDGSVRRGYEAIERRLQSLLANAPESIGVGQYANGANYYANRLRHHTTSALSAAEIHQLGLDELVRIQAEMRAIFDELGYPQNESLRLLFERVAADGGTIPAAEVLSTYENLIEFARQRLDVAFDIFPAADVAVVPDEFGGFYVSPSFDGTRPGAFHAGTSRDEPWYGMPSLAFHEALPGHHTQIALQMEQDVPAFRKLVRFTGFTEGWALYAERLAWELGWYEDDVYGDLGRLQFEALRAARLVIDTGIHNFGWSFDRAARFNTANVGTSTSSSEGAAARYSVIPGQATAYMVGMLVILDERQRAMDALGSDFDLVAFHRALLSNGAVPLSVLPGVVDQYIAEVQAGL